MDTLLNNQYGAPINRCTYQDALSKMYVYHSDLVRCTGLAVFTQISLDILLNMPRKFLFLLLFCQVS